MLPSCRQLAAEAGHPFSEATWEPETMNPPQPPDAIPNCGLQELRLLFPKDDQFYPSAKIDPENSFDVWLWEHLQGKSLAEWIELHSYRSPKRSPYGAEPTGRKRKHLSTSTSTDENFQSTSEHSSDGKRASIPHSIKEQDRRERHRRIQQHSDMLCSEFHFNLAIGVMEEVKKLYNHQQLDNKRGVARCTGKDEQLVATLFCQRLGQLINEAHQERNGEFSMVLSSIFLSEEPQTPSKRPRLDLPLRLKAHL